MLSSSHSVGHKGYESGGMGQEGGEGFLSGCVTH